jgi:hypothetical protein
VRPKTPAPSFCERIQMIAPIIMMNAAIADVSGQGLGFTRW